MSIDVSESSTPIVRLRWPFSIEVSLFVNKFETSARRNSHESPGLRVQEELTGR